MDAIKDRNLYKLLNSDLITEPHAKLYLAILIDAIQCFTKTAADITYPNCAYGIEQIKEREASKARHWIRGSSRAGITFDEVCTYLKLDPDVVRRLIFNETQSLQKAQN